METEVEEVRVAKAEERRGRNKKTEKTKKGVNNKGEQDSRRMRDIGRGREGSKVRREGKEVSTRKIPLINIYLWKETKWEDASKKDIGSCNWNKRRIYTEEEESISVLERGKRRGIWVYLRIIKERIIANSRP